MKLTALTAVAALALGAAAYADTPAITKITGCEVKKAEGSNYYTTVVPGCITAWQKSVGIYTSGSEAAREAAEDEKG